MGQSYAFRMLIESEKKQWLEHNLQFDGDSRAANIDILSNITDGQDIYLGYTKSVWGNFEFQHWFVTTGIYFIEFGAASLDIYKARVSINTQIRDFIPVKIGNTKMDQEIRDRIFHVLGMRNYSLCLRNCEHVANYIIRNRWISSQMEEERGVIFNNFKSYFLGNTKKLVNVFPSDIRPHVFRNNPNKIYSFITDNFTPTSFNYYLDSNDGKSHLINVFFNQEICDAKVSHSSVTREIYFIRGRGSIFDIAQKEFMMKDVMVADTIGLCDTEWDDNAIIEMIKSRISSNCKYIDAVYIVYRADRLLKEHVTSIKKILDWLNYGKFEKSFLRFLFVSTYADHLTIEKKEELRKEAAKIFGIENAGDDSKRTFVNDETKKFNSMIYVGFPPEEYLNDLSKEKVKESWEQLSLIRTIPGNTDRIRIPVVNSCNIL